MAEVYNLTINDVNLVNSKGLEASLRAALGSKISGKSTRPYDEFNHVVEVHFLVEEKDDIPPQADLDLAQDVVGKHGTLGVSVDQASIVANGVAVATVACSDVLIVGDSDVDVTVWQGDEVYMETAQASVVAGVATAALATIEAGVYLVEFKRRGG